ncbi:MAG: hypothetical protein OEU26_23935 [Candidatus Tectomicrobia bacterium]|nr:hypothetical protein [Candidatus Tectomicrobia bacterium]
MPTPTQPNAAHLYDASDDKLAWNTPQLVTLRLDETHSGPIANPTEMFVFGPKGGS